MEPLDTLHGEAAQIRRTLNVVLRAEGLDRDLAVIRLLAHASKLAAAAGISRVTIERHGDADGDETVQVLPAVRDLAVAA